MTERVRINRLKKWILALKSGQFRKCTETYSRMGHFCVLGLGVAVAKIEYCSSAIRAYYGIDLNMTEDLIKRNDAWRWTLPRIGTWLANQLNIEV